MSERGLTAGLAAEIVKGLVRPVAFLEAEFANGVVRLWSGTGEFTWDNKVWTGTGDLGSISSLPESADVEALGVELELSGIPSAMISRVLSEIRQGKPVTIWLGGQDAAGAVIASPYKPFDGRMDAGSVAFGPQTSKIKIQAESRRRDLKRADGAMYDHHDQQARFPGDEGFEYVPELQDKNLTSGRGTTPLPTGGGGSGGGGGRDDGRFDDGGTPITF